MSKRICVFGASITWGACDYEVGGWVARLRKYIETNDYDYSIYNLGVSGATTNDILKRFDVETEARRPEIIIFAIGVNDSAYLKSEKDNWVPIKDFKENLKILNKKANTFTKNVVFVGLTQVDESKTLPIPWEENIFYKNEEVKKYNQTIKDLCEKNDLLFIETYDLLDKDDLEDGLHPNSAGHEKMFKRVKDF